MKKNYLCTAILLGAAMLCAFQNANAETDPTRGIGIYPGRPSEYFGPKVVAGGNEYRNVALFRAVSHSSSSDYLRTAQLVTDGLCADSAAEPGRVLMSTWRSATEKNEWIAIDLGSISKIDMVSFHWVNAPVGGVLQVSQDGKIWNDLVAFASEKEVTFPKTKTRYVRAVLNKTSNGEPFELAEFEVYGKGGAKTVPAKAAVRTGNKHVLAGGNWKLCRASEVTASGEELSQPAFNVASWMDATVPGTVLASYLNVGAVHDPNHAANQDYISDDYFRNDFWYRNTFEAHLDTPRQFLHFCGINFKAEVYLNGKHLANLVGAFRETDIDVTGILKEGKNALAVKIIRNDNYGKVKPQDVYYPGGNGGILGADNPTMHASIGWDWLPTVRGRNIGIYDEVYVRYTGDVCVEDPFVRTELPLPDTTSANIIAQATLVNHSDKPVTGVLKGSFGELTFEQETTIAPGESKIVAWDPIKMENPKLWWPKGYGEPNLYDVKFSFEMDGKVSDACSFKSGVRQMTYNLYDYEPVSSCYFKKGRNNKQRLDIYINGRRFNGFGGNWGFPEHLLNYRDREYDVAVGYHADQNFNMIRNWVGMTGSRAFYEACDRHGIMIWQDFWLANPGDGPNPTDPQRFKETAQEYVRLIRNHPSIALYCARNEGYPPKDIDEFLEAMVPAEHPDLFYIPHSGADGVSGGGRYWLTPVKDYFDNLFGADKMHSERGIPSILNYENLVRAFGEENVNPVSSHAHPNVIYGKHDYNLGGDRRWVAQRTEEFNQLLAKAFGEPADAREFAKYSQWMCYDGFRAIFESRAEHRYGLLLWMSHPAWPSMVWQTYDYYYEPLAGYFGCKKGCEPLHIFFNPIAKNIQVVDYSAGNHVGLKAVAQILDLNAKEVWSNTSTLDIEEDQTKVCFPLEVPADITDVYFVRLYLYDASGKLVSENFYCQGKEEGNLQAVRTLPQEKLSFSVSRQSTSTEYVFTAKLVNEGETPALMQRLKVVDEKSGDLILPVWYSDNYISLMPGESKVVTARVRHEDCSSKPVLCVE